MIASTSDSGRAKASSPAIYPRVYTEDQVRDIVADVCQNVGDLFSTYFNGAEGFEEVVGQLASDALDRAETPFNRLVYPVLGILGEAGEIAEKIKKTARDRSGQMSADEVEGLAKELGDAGGFGK